MKSVLGPRVHSLCVALLMVLSACGGGAGSGKNDVETGPTQDAVVDTTAEVRVSADSTDAVDLLAELPPDTLPPVVKIISPKDGAVVSGTQTIVVDATDDRGVAVVDVYLEGELLGTVPMEPWELLWDTTALATGNYRLVAVASDEAGNIAQDEVEVLIQGSCDESGDCPPKSVKIITPVAGSTVCGTVTIEATAQDDNGLAEVEFFVDGDSLGVDVESPYQKDWETTGDSKGEHQLKVIARDSSGQEAFATISVLVDNSGGSCDNLPNVVIEQPVDSEYVYGTVEVMAKASDDIGVLKVQFFVDNALVAEDGTAPYKMGWDSDEFDEGAHTLKAIAYDTGDQMGTMQIQVTVDRTPPELEILSPETQEPFQETLPVVATASDNFVVKQVEFSVEYQTEPVVLTTSPYEVDLDLSTVSSGWQVLFASAVDGAGHVTESWTDFLVDRPPAVAFIEPGEGETVFGQVAVTVEAMDDLDNPAVDFFVDGALVGEMYGVDGYEYDYYWETPYEKADYVLKVVARDDWEQTATAELAVLVDHPVEAVLLVCEANECAPLSDGTELAGAVKLKVEAKDDGADIEQVEFHVDGNLVKVVDNQPWEYQWDTEASGDGLHTVKIVAANTLAEKGEDSAEVLVNNCDLDHDTYLAATCDGSDCDDLNPDKNPGELDTVGNKQDENCDGIDGVDADGDGHASLASGGDDCDDSNGEAYVGHPDTVGNAVDDNCDGMDGVDVDLDGYASLASGGDDCDDENPGTHPGKSDSVGNAVDENCDGIDGVDADGDGHASVASGGDDCDDDNPLKNPGIVDTVGNGKDDNCDGADGVDGDGDGHASLASGGDDCDDSNPAKRPGAIDKAGNAVDENCDGLDGVDADGDLQASIASGGSDCDDGNALVFQGQTDVVGNGVDDNCDGLDGVDQDGDKHASEVSGGDDCDDLDPTRNPAAFDNVGNGLDENCDGIDGEDADADGYLSIESGGGDCGDNDADVHPCAEDIGGDGEDSNCDGQDLTSCDDCDPCTEDSFQVAGCQHAPLNDGEECDDGDVCTTGEGCVAGQCGGGEGVVCDDGNVCTKDSCISFYGCNSVADGALNGATCAGGVCAFGECCTPACAGKECGDDGCAGMCGNCEADEYCAEGGACEACDIDIHAALHCGDVLELDTAEGTNAYGGYGCVGWEENGPELGFSYSSDVADLVVVTVEETGDADHDLFLFEDTCPPEQCTEYSGSELQFMAVPGSNYFLVVDGYGDDVGTLTLSVWCQSTCKPDCGEDSACQDDGCLGTCPCADQKASCHLGECCIPDCEGKICGDDGCGGSCGDCEGACLDKLICMDGPGCVSTGEPGCEDCACEACVCELDPYCCETAWDGTCVSECVDGCGGCLTLDNCGDNSCVLKDKETCSTCPEDCVCGQFEFCYQNACCATECNADNGCQPDGCGGVCPCDTEEAVCFDGTCCFAACEEVMGCQDDGCGGVCACETEEEVCFGGECCIPICAGKACGDDGCGGNCGICDIGACVEDVCLDAPGCVTSNGPGCGGCPCEACVCAMDAWCCQNSWDGLCVGECVDDCGGCVDLSNCGDGACESEVGENCSSCSEDCTCPVGEVCGTLNNGAACVQDMCVMGLPEVGCCEDGVLYGCTEGATFALDCATLEDKICGWYAGDVTYSAGHYCGPSDLIEAGGDPSGEYPMECSTCDPSCGEGEKCVGGECVLCFPDCGGNNCGADGCGGECGQCQDGLECQAGLCASLGCKELSGAGCGGCPCEACVCEMDSFCCETQWDSICVKVCVEQCGGCPS